MTGKEANNENQTQPETKARSVLEMSAPEAREFFLKGESYRKMDLPAYFVFDDLLKFISDKIGSRCPTDKAGQAFLDWTEAKREEFPEAASHCS